MAQYAVKQNQNIFDVALLLYGSVEGIFDLLITNQGLNMVSDLVPGQILEYHEDFVINQSIVEEFKESRVVPGNGSRQVYAKEPDPGFVPFAIVGIPANAQFASFAMAGEGTILADWGDNSGLQRIELPLERKTFQHHFNNETEERRIRLYGEESGESGHLKCSLTYFDATGLEGAIAMLRPLVVDEFVSQSNGYSLAGLFLFEGTHAVDLRRSMIPSLLPLAAMENLQELHLEDAYIPSVDILDDYLRAIVTTPTSTGRRVGCKVYLTNEPSEAGWEAIDTILGEEEWNSPIPWQFFIHGVEYKLPTT